MIKNERGYKITRAAAAKFEHALTDHEAQPLKREGGISRAAEISALRAQIASLRSELADYERLRSGGIEELHTARLEDLPTLLIRARIAEGLTHEQLAERLGVKPQQIQRWEDDDYQSAAFWRLIEVADALGLSLDIKAWLPHRSVPDTGIVVDKLRRDGVDKSFLAKKLIPMAVEGSDPNETARVLAGRLEAIFGRPFADLVAENDDQPWGQRAAANGRFKIPAKSKEAPVVVFSAYAHFLAASLCDLQMEPIGRKLPEDWASMRAWLFGNGRPDLKTAVERVWGAGIPVLPLSGKGAPHGACWKIRGRGAIVLKQSMRTPSRWLFDLVHELRHLVEAGDSQEFEMLEEEGTSDGRRLSEEEGRAHAFAANVLLGGKADSLYSAVLKDAGSHPARMKGSIQRIAQSEGVEVSLLANHAAFSFYQDSGENIWGAAHKLQEAYADPFDTVRRVLLEKIDIRTVSEPAAGLLQQALE